MAAEIYVSASGVAAIVTTIELALRNQRHPFNGSNFKPIGWWLVIVLLDSFAAVAVLAGLVQLNESTQQQTQHSSPIVYALLVGLIGPLALRSPIRDSDIRGRSTPVGVTYIYDIARVYALYALDEQLTRLRRRDVRNMRISWRRAGFASDAIAEELRAHVTENVNIDDASRDVVLDGIDNALTLPDEDQRIDSLIKMMRKERFRSIRDHYNSAAKRSVAPGAPLSEVHEEFNKVRT